VSSPAVESTSTRRRLPVFTSTADGENTEPDDKTEDLVESADEGDSNE